MALLLTQEAAANAANKESAEAQEKNNELFRKVDELQDIVQRLEAKVANLESEIQVLRQQAIAISPTAVALATRPRTTIIQDTSRVLSKELDSEEKPQKLLNEEQQNTSPILFKKLESGEELQKSLNYEKQQENQDLLIKCITEYLGFSGGRPVAACLIYKCLLHWRSFEDERTDIFDRIIQTIDSAIEDNTDTLLYWLSNSCTLLLLLQRTLQASGPASLTPQRQVAPPSLFGRMQGIRSSPQSAGLPFFSGHMGLSDVRQVEAKCPAMHFKQQLTAILENIYRWIRYNLKEEISPWLEAPPSTSRASLVKSLTKYLEKLKANYVSYTSKFAPEFLIILLLKREYCSFSNGEYVKAGLAELEHWCFDATEEYAGSAWDELKHIRQAAGFLVIHQKPKKTLKEITNNLCPVLNIQQLYRISTMYWDDKYGTNSVSLHVISSMRTMMTEDSNGAFLLDDDSSIPFSVDDISNSVTEIEVAEVDPPPLLRQNSGFAFLLQRKD